MVKPLSALAAATTNQQPLWDPSKDVLTPQKFYQLYKGHIVTTAEQLYRAKSMKESVKSGKSTNKSEVTVLPNRRYKLLKRYERKDGCEIFGKTEEKRAASSPFLADQQRDPFEEVYFPECPLKMFRGDWFSPQFSQSHA